MPIVATFSAMWSEPLEAKIKELSTEPYDITFQVNASDYEVFARAVNRGIDSHLEAVILTQTANRFTISADTLHVLVRRLFEDGSEAGDSFASCICETLGIELV